MKGRTVSLPDLVSDKRRNTALSLSEGFTGARYEAALGATALNSLAKPLGPLHAASDGEAVSPHLEQLLQVYYRTRGMLLSMEKAGQRAPAKVQSDLRAQEKALTRELRPVHPLLFQRMDEAQLERLVRAMPFLRLSEGRWIFGAAGLGAEWPRREGQRAFLLLSGTVALFPDAAGAGDVTAVKRGAVFGERSFALGDEGIRGIVCGAARCEAPCIVGMLTTAALEAAFADRAFGNRRIAQVVRNVPALSRVMHADSVTAGKVEQASAHSRMPSKLKPGQTMPVEPVRHQESHFNAAVKSALGELVKLATTIHVRPMGEVLSEEPLNESVLIVSRGELEVRGDVTLTEKLESIPPRRVRIRIFVERAKNLAGDSVFDKLDPYCIVKLGEFKRFQTPVLLNAGKQPKWEHSGVLMLDDRIDKTLEFTVMDHDKLTADDLCGTGSCPLSELHDGYSGYVDLTRPRKGLFRAEENELMEAAGRVYFSVRYDYEEVTALTRTPKVRCWKDLDLFTLKENDCWGHESLLLGPVFMRTLEQASSKMEYHLSLENLRVTGAYSGSGNDITSVWKIAGPRFVDFVKQCGRLNPFVQACRVSALEKQQLMKALATRLVQKWEVEEQQDLMQNGLPEAPAIEEAMDPSHFRVAYRGVKAHISVRNAVNLRGGGWFDKLDPYAVVRFRGSRQEFRTSVLHDVGADPVWDCEGSLTYNGETALEMSVWDYDKYSADDLLATGSVTVDKFVGGFEGMVQLSFAAAQKKPLKPAMIVIGIQWDPPRDPSATGTLGASLTGLKSLTQTVQSQQQQLAAAS